MNARRPAARSKAAREVRINSLLSASMSLNPHSKNVTASANNSPLRSSASSTAAAAAAVAAADSGTGWNDTLPLGKGKEEEEEEEVNEEATA